MKKHEIYIIISHYPTIRVGALLSSGLFQKYEGGASCFPEILRGMDNFKCALAKTYLDVLSKRDYK